MEIFWRLIGWAFLPFVVATIFRTTNAGAKKIAWVLDIVALLVALGVYWLVESKVGPILGAKLHSVGIIASAVLGYLVVAIALPLIYSMLNAMGTEPPRATVAETPAHGHGDHGHGHGDHGHGGAKH